MRLIYTVHDAEKGRKLSNFLSGQGIANQLDMATNTDWGSTNYGDVTCKLWVIDEDAFDKAMHWVDEFEQDSNNPVFLKGTVKPTVRPQILSPKDSDIPPKDARYINIPNVTRDGKVRRVVIQPEAFGPLTIGFIILCTVIFMICELTAPNITTINTTLPVTPVVSAPIKKQMLYDYPRAYELIDKLVNLYGPEKLIEVENLPSEGKYILAEFHKTPYWQGAYDLLVNKLHGQPLPETLPPMFEKIEQGELWRLFTPALLHADIIHLLFNMLWLMILGKQIEQRLSPRRYLFLILLIGIFSNTCQYLISGSNFLGFSGILCGMLTFIWMRQRLAPWEGYPLQRSTFLFMMTFIAAMLGLQLLSFVLEVTNVTDASAGIANAAHISGAIIGALLGRFSFFRWNANNTTRTTR